VRSVDEWTYGASSALVTTEAARWSAEVNGVVATQALRDRAMPVGA
jgi:hypothetical protein